MFTENSYAQGMFWGSLALRSQDTGMQVSPGQTPAPQNLLHMESQGSVSGPLA